MTMKRYREVSVGVWRNVMLPDAQAEQVQRPGHVAPQETCA